MGPGPLKGPGKICIFRCSVVQSLGHLAAKWQTKQNNGLCEYLCSSAPQFHSAKHDFHNKGGQTTRGTLILCPPPFENGVGLGDVHVPSTLSRGRCKSVKDGGCV